MINKLTSGKLIITSILVGAGLLVYGLTYRIGGNNDTGKILLSEDNAGSSIITNEAKVEGKKVIKNVELDLDRVVYIEGPIEDLTKQVEQLKVMNEVSTNRPIHVLLNSPGGSVVDGNAFVSAIEASKAPVHTVCVSMCASMAAVIHQYGTKRLMVDRSILMFHSASAGTRGTVEQMKSFTDFLNRYIEKTEKYIAKRSGKKYEDFKNDVQREVWIDAEDSVNQNYADGLVNIINVEEKDVIQYMVPGDKTNTQDETKRTWIEDVRWQI